MTIEYKDSKRIVGLSSDTKPTNVQDNSLLVEKDVARRYWFNARGADTTTTNSNVNDVAHFEGTVGANYVIGEQITSGNALIGKSITSLSFWLYKLNSGSSGTETFTFGIWDSSGALQKEYGSITRGEIPQGSTYTDGQKFTKTDSIGYTLQENDIIGVRTDTNPNSAWTVEVTQRDSDVYSNGQRALFIQGSTPTTSAKDIGFEVVSATPATWTMQPTWRDDTFSSGWVTNPSSGSEFAPNTSTGVIDFAVPNESGFNDMVYYDLETISDDSWVLRFKWSPTTWSLNTDGTQPEFFAILTSSETANSNDSQNALGLATFKASSNTYMAGVHSESASLGDGDLTNMRITSASAFTTGDKWFEFIRSSPTEYTVTIYSDEYSTPIESKTHTISSGINGLQYLKFIGSNLDGTTNGTFEGTIDDVEFYDGVTSIN